MKKINHDVQKRMTKCDAEKQDLADQVSNLQKQINDLRNTIAELTFQADQFDKEKVGFDDKMNEKNSKIKNLQKEMAKVCLKF